MINRNIYGFLKSSLDAHTMGICAAMDLLEEVGCSVFSCSHDIAQAFDKLDTETNAEIIVNWILKNKISHVGLSYRLDPNDALELTGRLYRILCREGLYGHNDSQIKKILFSGLPSACRMVEKEFNNRVETFEGGESVEVTLLKMGISYDDIPKHIIAGSQYDKDILEFGKKVVSTEEYKREEPLTRKFYPEYGTPNDGLLKRLDNNFCEGFHPLVRAHSGPYSKDLTREQCLLKFYNWCKQLSTTGFLDILSIGTSQLSQSNFGENWNGYRNGGGVPVNSPLEFQNIWQASKPMLVRTYSGTKRVKDMAKIYEETINMAWHALSLWWFNELDGRGHNGLYDNLKEHIDTIKYIASIKKPFEANVSHHFAFRGCDDVTYIVSAYIAAKLAKKCGIKYFILQNMLNTPRSTWGINDLAKSRALLSLVKSLQDNNFRVILQTRTGLDYFKPNIDEAKIQLSAATALMDDIDANNPYSPEIIHVVSYSEALFLATPDVINDSIKITRNSLRKYRALRKLGMTPNVNTIEIQQRTIVLYEDAKKIISSMEQNIDNLYSPEGLYIAFVSGWLPVPELWNNLEEYRLAKNWKTKRINGGVDLIDRGLTLSVESRIDKCVSNLQYAHYYLKQRQLSNRILL